MRLEFTLTFSIRYSILDIFLILSTIAFIFCSPVIKSTNPEAAKSIITGADQTEKYLPLLKGKRVAIMGNPTSIIGKTHLVDSLKKLGINIVKVFGPDQL